MSNLETKHDRYNKKRPPSIFRTDPDVLTSLKKAADESCQSPAKLTENIILEWLIKHDYYELAVKK